MIPLIEEIRVEWIIIKKFQPLRVILDPVILEVPNSVGSRDGAV